MRSAHKPYGEGSVTTSVCFVESKHDIAVELVRAFLSYLKALSCFSV